MDTKYLDTFLTASRTLNFTKTAKLLKYAQSSITAQIKGLEEELKTPLFERLGKEIHLTEAGRKLQIYAEKMVSLQEEMKTEVGGKVIHQETLAIGAQESQCTYRLPMILQTFKNHYPQVNVVFKSVHSSEIAEELLREGQLDLAFITDIKGPEAMIHKELLVDENIMLIASPQHPLAKKQRCSWNDLEGETILLTEKGCSFRSQFERKLEESGIQPGHLIEFVSIEAIKQCVKGDLGLAFLPAIAVEKEQLDGTILPLQLNLEFKPIVTQVAWHKDKIMTPVLSGFLEVVKMHFKEESAL